MKRGACIVGWAAVWSLFALFNLLLLSNRIEELIKLTLYSLLPIWVLTVIGGSLEIAELLRQRRRILSADGSEKKGNHDA